MTANEAIVIALIIFVGVLIAAGASESGSSRRGAQEPPEAAAQGPPAAETPAVDAKDSMSVPRRPPSALDTAVVDRAEKALGRRDADLGEVRKKLGELAEAAIDVQKHLLKSKLKREEPADGSPAVPDRP